VRRLRPRRRCRSSPRSSRTAPGATAARCSRRRGASTPRSPEAAIDAEALRRYADLTVGFAANVQPGQIVELRSALGREPLTRAIAESCYRHGARFVDFAYLDPWIRKARIEHAPDDSLDFVPSWHRERVLGYGRERCARIAVGGVVAPDLLDGLDPQRVARDRWPFIREYHDIIDDQTTNWTGVNCATPEWAALVYPDEEPDRAVARLWDAIAHICRLDEADPRAAWETRLATIHRARSALNDARFDALHFEGPGTDLTVGLLPTSTWDSGWSDTVDGIRHMANLPTEEAFTAPDPARTDGVVRATKPLVLRTGIVVEGLRVRFEGGRAVEIEADRNGEVLRAEAERDEGAARLGEVALVDGESRIGRLGTVFYDTLFDENAASHVALGSAYLETVGEEDRERANRSGIHIDFMIGGDDVAVTGITRAGERVPVLRGGSWRI
jgi:aminopeptidase